jgi:hypothetical protein
MSSNPIERVGTPVVPTANQLPTESSIPDSVKPVAKTPVKPPLVRPFSLSLPPDNTAAHAIINNIDASNKETERLTKKSADEEHLKQMMEKQKAQDQVLNGPGRDGV